jgi:hypothetical protein
MSTQNIFRQDTGVRQAELNSLESQNHHKNIAAPSADYYTEWAIERSSIERTNSGMPGNAVGFLSGNVYKSRNISNKYKRVRNENGDTNVSTFYNEVYNRAELFNFP